MLDMLRPDQYAASLAEVDVDQLKQDGFDTLLVDLDNTLLPWSSSDVPESSRNWVEHAKHLGMRIRILSNTHNPARLGAIAGELGVGSIDRAFKPSKTGFFRAVREAGSEPGKTVVVGDQIITDILGGNRAGMRTILVHPMDSREFIGTRISRLLEKVIFALIHRAGKPGTISRSTQSEKQDTK
ncbi:MAG: hypothetical protein A2Z18_06345 [Armatimonadetes bacterium RBG_16_58_9]|nr:MAG: hypothetical protein A2Z18_06345 [Armatimonadetes bacterium RBG_16_58_9]